MGTTTAGDPGAISRSARPNALCNRRVLRSRLGCETCKSRRVKCSEGRPVCASCARLGLDCEYLPPPRQRPRVVASRTTTNETQRPEALFDENGGPENASHRDTDLDHANQASVGEGQNPRVDSWPGEDFTSIDSTAGFINQPRDPWFDGDLMQSTYNGTIPGLSPLWEGYGFNHQMWEGVSMDLMPCTMAVGADINPNYVALQLDGDLMNSIAMNPDSGAEDNYRNISTHDIARPAETCLISHQEDACLADGLDGDSDGSTQAVSSPMSASYNSQTRINGAETKHLLSLFQSVVQPPASILIGGLRKWRRLQHYLVGLSGQSDLVFDGLICVIEFLFVDELSQTTGQSRETRFSHIMDRRQSLITTLRARLQQSTKAPTPLTNEQQLGALLLLAWFEAMRDQDQHSSPFPRDVADSIILRDTDWSRSSRVLLSWLWSLDSKATHLTSERRLFSEQALLVLARHPYRVVISQAEDNDEDAENEALESTGNLKLTPPESSQEVRGRHLERQPRLALTGPHIEQIMLHSLLQPAIDWYMDTQAFCRRIRSHDRHHRPRGTPDDEFAVIMAGNRLEKQLWEIWDQRPAIISLGKDELCRTLPTDLALRLHEVYSVHLACYWVLFLYLHRVVWWHLPHSPTTRSALNRVWELFQQSYGEVVNGSKIVHPGLLWQVFLFGSECTTEAHRTWTIQQLGGLASAKAVLRTQPGDRDGLPPFKMSAGVTRNAKRALLLLKELIRRQEETKVRVDDRSLSMEMFGCYFSLV